MMKKFLKLIAVFVFAAACMMSCRKDKPLSQTEAEVRSVTGTEWLMEIIAAIPDSEKSTPDSEHVDTIAFMAIELNFATDSTVVLTAYMVNPETGEIDWDKRSAEENAIYEYKHPHISIYEDPTAEKQVDVVEYVTRADTEGGEVPPTQGETEFVMRLTLDETGNLLHFDNIAELLTGRGGEDLLKHIVSDPVFRKVIPAK